MTEVDGSLILSVLHRLQADMTDLRQDVGDLSVRVTVREGHLAGLLASRQLANERLDRISNDLARIKRRLDLVESE